MPWCFAQCDSWGICYVVYNGNKIGAFFGPGRLVPVAVSGGLFCSQSRETRKFLTSCLLRYQRILFTKARPFFRYLNSYKTLWLVLNLYGCSHGKPPGFFMVSVGNWRVVSFCVV